MLVQTEHKLALFATNGLCVAIAAFVAAFFAVATLLIVGNVKVDWHGHQAARGAVLLLMMIGLFYALPGLVGYWIATSRVLLKNKKAISTFIVWAAIFSFCTGVFFFVLSKEFVALLTFFFAGVLTAALHYGILHLDEIIKWSTKVGLEDKRNA